MTFLRERLLSAVAGQLGRPHGILSPFVARALNRGNQKAIVAAVEAAHAPRGGVAADVGFGGGVGLELLLNAIGEDGVVHGVEVAEDMLRRAKSKFGSDGRLRLARGSLTELPLDDGSVDALITVNTVYFISELDAACRELVRVLRHGGRAVIGIGDPDVMAKLPFTKHGFTIRPVTEIAAALQNSGLQVEQRRIEDKPIPRFLLIGTRA
ncbi:methylase involved in ubiquinone/menaquinone biosynthesis [Mycobacterium sp. JS623]|uniref:class I SAM-dependent methyltransferase n=1 Tax=Mycobacterium sp. JS623 TaxID=212767 RepID=UPI0002A5805A|nr:methyltransferase domain-containing protein [Mycobacterium sp. JS623]AGB22650.1 methylase involved in ubiquinone/menaquinone biosynthesis [Mycobacterium sp. JS623]